MAKQYVLTCDMCGGEDKPENQILRVYVLKVGRDMCRNDRAEFLKAINVPDPTRTDLLDQQEQDAATARGRGRKPKAEGDSQDAESTDANAPTAEGDQSATEGEDKKPAGRGRKGKTEEAQPA